MKLSKLNKKRGFFWDSKKGQGGGPSWTVIVWIIAIIALLIIIPYLLKIRVVGGGIFSCQSKMQGYYRCENPSCEPEGQRSYFLCEKGQICCYYDKGYEGIPDTGVSGGGGIQPGTPGHATIIVSGEKGGPPITPPLIVKAEEEKTVYISVEGEGINTGSNGCLVYLYDEENEQYLRIVRGPTEPRTMREYFKCQDGKEFSFNIPNEYAKKDISLQIVAYKQDCGNDNKCEGIQDWAGSYKADLFIEPKIIDNEPPIIKIGEISDYWEEEKTIYIECYDFNPFTKYREECNILSSGRYEIVSGSENCPQRQEDFSRYLFDYYLELDYRDIPLSEYFSYNYLCVYLEDQRGNGGVKKSIDPIKIVKKCDQNCGENEDICYCGEGQGNVKIPKNHYCAGDCLYEYIRDPVTTDIFYDNQDMCALNLEECRGTSDLT